MKKKNKQGSQKKITLKSFSRVGKKFKSFDDDDDDEGCQKKTAQNGSKRILNGTGSGGGGGSDYGTQF